MTAGIVVEDLLTFHDSWLFLVVFKKRFQWREQMIWHEFSKNQNEIIRSRYQTVLLCKMVKVTGPFGIPESLPAQQIQETLRIQRKSQQQDRKHEDCCALFVGNSMKFLMCSILTRRWYIPMLQQTLGLELLAPGKFLVEHCRLCQCSLTTCGILAYLEERHGSCFHVCRWFHGSTF